MPRRTFRYFRTVHGVAAAATDEAPAHIRVIETIKEHQSTHPRDYVGLNAAIVAAGGRPVTFDFPQAGLRNLSPMQAQAAVDSGKPTSAAVQRTGESTLVDEIPNDAFEVSGFWTDVQDQTGRWVTYYGTWDFKGGYYDGDYPRDALAIEIDGKELMNSKCYKYSSDSGWAQSVIGDDNSGYLTRRSITQSSAVWNLDDSASTRWVDHGAIYISYQNVHTDLSVGCGGVWHGKTYLEHNLDGCNCQWSFSLSAGVFSISYSETDPPVSLQKSTGLIEKYSES
jgi:hypothetical protein